MHSFRPRPIDVNQPLPIITDESIAKEIDDEVILYERTTGRLPHSKVPDGTRVLKRKQPSPSISDVHTPLFRVLEDKNEIIKGPRFARPHTYIEYKEKAPEEYNSEIEYEVDTTDELFIEAFNGRLLHPQAANGRTRTRGSTSKREAPAGISSDLFERLIDSLEKEAFFKCGLRQIRDGSTTGVICSICNDWESDSNNVLIFCHGCNTTVHQHCYGIAQIPHGPWLCRRCESREHTAQCILCNGREGALKRTDDNRWVHILCALYMPEASFGDETTLEPIEGIDNIPKDKWNKSCSICNEAVGVCVACDQKDCSSSYHIGCARSRGFFVEARLVSGSVVLRSYCKNHSLVRLDNYPRYPRELQHEMTDSISIAVEAGLSEEDYDIIYSYWRVKRRAHVPPLLPRLRVLSETGYVPGNSTLSTAEYRYRFFKLRQDFERARMLVDLVRKRELAKRQYLQVFADLFEVTEDLTLNPHKRGPGK